ncbi:MAG TPA: response regulator [Rhodopila sp.]|jgi:CheY-like chemotaxis protein|nr:response regulator [Rhodopila sp.]
MALILVVDDEHLLAMLLADTLTDEGHEVVMASNGRAALERIRERRPAVVITDFMMPIMTGLEFAEAVHADAEIADIPIILLSGAQGSLARQRSELFFAVFDKPFDIQAFLIEVRNAIAQT